MLYWFIKVSFFGIWRLWGPGGHRWGRRRVYSLSLSPHFPTASALTQHHLIWYIHSFYPSPLHPMLPGTFDWCWSWLPPPPPHPRACCCLLWVSILLQKAINSYFVAFSLTNRSATCFFPASTWFMMLTFSHASLILATSSKCLSSFSSL